MTDDQRFDAWGGPLYHGGSAPTPQTGGWDGGADYQTDADLGRFPSPDPTYSGTNWYALG